MNIHMHTDCLQEKIKLFLDNAPRSIREGSENDQLLYLLTKAPIRDRIQPVLEAALLPHIQKYRKQ
jgi:hypothetical protein